MTTLINEALGPIRPEVAPWKTNAVAAGTMFSFGQVQLTPEAAQIVNKFKEEAATRNLTLPKALMLAISYLLTEDHVDES